jgi:hypothetical protein
VFQSAFKSDKKMIKMKYLVLLLILFSCKFSKNKDLKIATETLDTIKIAPPSISAAPALFETAFIKGTQEKVEKATFTFYGVTIGNLKVVSGRIIACDPMHTDEYGKPFTQLFPTGEFPVQLAIAGVDNGELIAFARIKFSDEPAVKWEHALLEGEKPLIVGGDDIHGYGVDGSVGLFIDQEALKKLNVQTVADFNGQVFKDLDKHYRNTWKYTMYGFGEHNLAAFTTGLGDGRYATYVGYDASGKPCRLTTDFDLFNWKKK